jgi:hypothetical protein
MSQEVADVLDAAADLIENVGHCKGVASIYDGNGTTAYCALGAISKAAMSANFGSLYAAATNALKVEIWGNPLRPPNDISAWNDKSERTAAEVIDTFRRAAKDLRNESGNETLVRDSEGA